MPPDGGAYHDGSTRNPQERGHGPENDDRTSVRTASNLRVMTVGGAVRWAVAAAWLVIALLLERIITLGGITDISGVAQNGPIFLAVGLGLVVLAVWIAILVAVDGRSWPTVSMAAGAAYIVAGVWLRLDNGDDSGAAVALAALLIWALARATLGLRRRDEARSARPPGA
jgi:hypothetical protein